MDAVVHESGRSRAVSASTKVVGAAGHVLAGDGQHEWDAVGETRAWKTRTPRDVERCHRRIRDSRTEDGVSRETDPGVRTQAVEEAASSRIVSGNKKRGW